MVQHHVFSTFIKRVEYKNPIEKDLKEKGDEKEKGKLYKI